MPDLPVSETVLLAWICGEESKFMEGLKMNQVNSKVNAFDFVVIVVVVVVVVVNEPGELKSHDFEHRYCRLPTRAR